MNRHSLIRRLERLENRLGNNPKWRVRVEFYDISPDGTLIRLSAFQNAEHHRAACERYGIHVTDREEETKG
jgi:hypothetical protein